MNKNFDATATPTTGLTCSVKGACTRTLAFTCHGTPDRRSTLMDLGPPGIFEMKAFSEMKLSCVFVSMLFLPGSECAAGAGAGARSRSRPSQFEGRV